MKLKTKITLGAAATVVTGVAAGLALNKKIDKLVDEHLHRDGIAVIKRKLMTKKNQEDFASNPEVNLGKLFYASTDKIDISILNREGRNINALLFKQESDSHKYAIVVHGYRASVKSVSYIAKRYYEAGYNVLLPYLRAHLGSDYDYCTMGWHERFDIVDWISYIEGITQSPKIVMHGVSMGAATVMNASGMELPKNIIGILIDIFNKNYHFNFNRKITLNL